jgi:hypothetical protein
MKTVKIFSLALLAVAFVLGSCSKYEEGPAFSLRTKKARVAGTWKVEKYVDSDGTTSYPDSDENGTVELTKDNTVKANFPFFGSQVTVSGEWEFIKDKEWLRIILDFNGEKDVEDSKILRLKNDELWLEDVDGDQTHYVPA